jgi:hypothetical protein
LKAKIFVGSAARNWCPCNCQSANGAVPKSIQARCTAPGAADQGAMHWKPHHPMVSSNVSSTGVSDRSEKSMKNRPKAGNRKVTGSFFNLVF